jgi:hypothetical protein
MMSDKIEILFHDMMEYSDLAYTNERTNDERRNGIYYC